MNESVFFSNIYPRANSFHPGHVSLKSAVNRLLNAKGKQKQP